MTLEIFASQLSLWTQGDDVTRIQQPMQALGRSVPVSETASRGLGTDVVAFLKGLQTKLGGHFPALIMPGYFKAIHDKLAKHRKSGEHLL